MKVAVTLRHAIRFHVAPGQPLVRVVGFIGEEAPHPATEACRIFNAVAITAHPDDAWASGALPRPLGVEVERENVIATTEVP